MTRLVLEGDKVIGVEAVNLQTGPEENYRGPVILATGHSARDVYRYLASSKIEIEAKGIAVGVRLEHPSQIIDQERSWQVSACSRIQFCNPGGWQGCI